MALILITSQTVAQYFWNILSDFERYHEQKMGDLMITNFKITFWVTNKLFILLYLYRTNPNDTASIIHKCRCMNCIRLCSTWSYVKQQTDNIPKKSKKISCGSCWNFYINNTVDMMNDIKAYFFHRDTQWIQVSRSRLHSHGCRGLHSYTDTSEHIHVHNDHWRTL